MSPDDPRHVPDPFPDDEDDDIIEEPSGLDSDVETADDKTALAADYAMDPRAVRHLQSVGLVGDYDPPACATTLERLNMLDILTEYVQSVPVGQSMEVDHCRRLMEAKGMGS